MLRVGPYRFFFYAGDGGEPPHIHVSRDDAEAKYWLAPTRLEWSHGFSSRDINQVQRAVEANHDFIVECWNELFDRG